ncbi:MAG: biotin--[acetyl-CoA-carboxylase] ligase [Deltaproteobacteria bacterium]|nr:biotin--[acetyl-CoA-carboxylase] ligase [Deltaproteobacteria bacterium]
MTPTDALQPQRIENALTGRSIGQRIIYYPCIDSTNRAARALALQGDAHGWVVLADEQSAGRGRLDRSWQSTAGQDILASIIVYPELAPAQAFRLTMIASIAVVLALRRVCAVACGIKWPNDIFLNGKKLCGILAEGQAGSGGMQFMVIGIGLNVNSTVAGRPELEHTAVSLRDATGARHERNTLIIALLEEFDSLYAAGAGDAGEHIRQLWQQHAIMIGRRVTITNGDDVLNGIARAILPDGSLIVRDLRGCDHTIVCGDLSLRLE